ncbi:MAG: zinc-binding dehydrogenase [Croceibacterium sp.]
MASSSFVKWAPTRRSTASTPTSRKPPAASRPTGVDAILALAGGDALERALDALRRDGRLAYPNGIEPEPRKRRGVKFIPYDAISGVREFERLNRAVEAAKLNVPIAEAFALVSAAKAHQRLAEGHVLGKIVLRTRQS